MCDFHSTAWRLLGQEIQCAHLANNSHGESIAAAGWRVNEPNRKTVVFEAEWDGVGDLPTDEALIRNSGECPHNLITAIRRHYTKLAEAIKTGKHLDGYFADTKKWCDVWNAAIANDVPINLPSVFAGDLTVSGSANIEALTKVGGDLTVSPRAKFHAPKLQRNSPFLYATH